VSAGVDEAVAEVGVLAAGLPALETGLGSIGAYLGAHAQAGDTTAAALLAGLQNASSALPTDDELAAMSTDLATLKAGASKVSAGTTALQQGLGTLASGAASLSAGTADLAQGTSRVASGAATLASATATLEAGSVDLVDGTQTLAAGATDLATGTQSLADGAGQLAAGSGRLTDGAQTLSDALGDGAAAIPDDSDALRTQRAETISSPVAVSSDDLAQAEGFGEGFAPFFISLALFVGALITWLLMRPLPSRALATPASGVRTMLAGFLPAVLIGVGQVGVMLGVIHFGIGLQIDDVAGTVAFTVLVAATFLALQQMLMALLGPAGGKVAVLALLMLQLASSGGTYPVETTPALFRVAHPLLPMSYAVTGLRQLITGGADGRLLASIAVLVGVLIGSLALTAWRAGRMRTWSLSRLHPALTI
ncbi:MAG: ABC transporter permease, partial [Cellulomonadaceae bacterium]|nr:ABC transporter permease [Cellulomonadaceae bacterium]